MSLSPKESARFIAENADHVRIDKEALPGLAELFYTDLRNGVFGASWDAHAMHPKAIGPDTVNWIFLVDSLNFSFWTDEDVPRYAVTFKGSEYSGYMALCAAVNRAIEEGTNLLDANVLANLTAESVKTIFRADDPSVTIPLLDTRLSIMREHAAVLLTNCAGSFTACIDAAGASAARLLDIICETFPSFCDKAVFKGQHVSFHKRAQILVADLWVAFKGESYGQFDDVDTITAFADYRVPQTLAYFGVLKYDEDLMSKLWRREHLENGSVWEVEIRGCCLQAVELFGGRSARCFRLARVRVIKALEHVKLVRETRRRDLQVLWDSRIDCACKDHGLPSSKVLYTGLSQANVPLNRNMLHTLSLYEPRTFESLVDIAKQYHLDAGCQVPHSTPPAPFVSRGMLTKPIVPGNRHLYQ